MHVVKLLHTLLKNTCQSIDKRLIRTLFDTVQTLAHCKQLSIIGLGRQLPRHTRVKHNIKCVDRLFGNPQLQRHRIVFYQTMVQLFIKSNQQPVIIVDWSGLTRCGAYHLLHASIAVDGRALTLYEPGYALKDYTSQKTHRSFLKTLKELLPNECRPIILTDAVFRNTWFSMVNALQWDFIGRVRNKTQYRATGRT